jgi:Flp pilus assembly pilin Flp
MKRFAKQVRGFFSDDSGQGTVEWVLITALVVVVIMGLIMIFREPIMKLISTATGEVSGWK